MLHHTFQQFTEVCQSLRITRRISSSLTKTLKYTLLSCFVHRAS